MPDKEREAKSGEHKITYPKQKTQPDGDEEFCQYGFWLMQTAEVDAGKTQDTI